jgi:hypothetical protein
VSDSAHRLLFSPSIEFFGAAVLEVNGTVDRAGYDGIFLEVQQILVLERAYCR